MCPDACGARTDNDNDNDDGDGTELRCWRLNKKGPKMNWVSFILMPCRRSGSLRVAEMSQVQAHLLDISSVEIRDFVVRRFCPHHSNIAIPSALMRSRHIQNWKGLR